MLVSFQLLSHTVVIEPANPASSAPQLFPILVRRTGTRGMSVGDVLVAIKYVYWYGISYPVSVYYSYRYKIRWYCTGWYGMAALGIMP